MSQLIIDAILLMLGTICAIAVIEVRSLFAAAMLAGLYSLIMAGVWTNMNAVDVAFTEAAVGAGIGTILTIGALVHVGRVEKVTNHRISWGALAVTIMTGAALIYGTMDMPRFGDPTAPIHTYRARELLHQNVGKPIIGHDTFTGGHPSAHASADPAHAPQEGHGVLPHDDFDGHVPNTVTSLLAAYRGFDTMFETAVIFTAGLGMVLLLRRRQDVPAKDLTPAKPSSEATS